MWRFVNYSRHLSTFYLGNDDVNGWQGDANGWQSDANGWQSDANGWHGVILVRLVQPMCLH